MDQDVAPRRRITVIDDHAEFLAVMQELLSLHHDVTAMSGDGVGPDDIAASHPDLLIVDLRLDRRDLQGWDLVSLARAHPELRAVPIIVCSADTQELNGRAGGVLGAGNTAMLTKPFTVAAVEEVVAQGLAGGFPDAQVPPIQDGYESLLSSETGAILVADEAGRYTDANDIALRLLGLTRDELRRRSVADLVESDRAWTDAEWQRYRRDGWWHGGVTLALPDGRTLRMLATARVVGTGDDRAYVSWLQPIEEGVALG